MTPEEKKSIAAVILELEGDVKEARTRDEAMRLTRRVLRLRRIIA